MQPNKCAYDECHTFIPVTANHKYCTECGCKRKRENIMKRLTVVPLGDQELWEAQEKKKLISLHRARSKNDYLLKNKTFAFFDIETSNLAASIGDILCACVRADGETKNFVSTTRHGDEKLIVRLARELRKYDYVVTWYGTGFDFPFLATRLLMTRNEPIGAIRHIDLYYTSRSRFKFHSNRLDAVEESLLSGKTRKTRIVGDIWRRAHRGNKEAMQYILDHCQKDVEILEDVFTIFAPHLKVSETKLRSF